MSMEAAKKIGLRGLGIFIVLNNPRSIYNKRYLDDPVIESRETFLETKHILLGEQT